MTRFRLVPLVLAFAALALAAPAAPQQPAPATPAPKAEDQARMPWARSDGWFVKTWLVAGPFAEALEVDPLASQGGEAALKGAANAEIRKADGSVVRWKEATSWSDAFGVDEQLQLTAPDSGTAYAYAAGEARGGRPGPSVDGQRRRRPRVGQRPARPRAPRAPARSCSTRTGSSVELAAGDERRPRQDRAAARPVGLLACGSSSRARCSPGRPRSAPPCWTRSRAGATLVVRTDVASPAPGGRT